MARRRHRSRLFNRVLVELGAAGFVVLIYVLVVVGGGALAGADTDRPNLALAVLATAVVAVTLEPVRAALRRRLDPSPGILMTRFSHDLTVALTTDQVPFRMAQLVGEATGSRRVEVWVTTDGPPSEADLLARWPETADPIDRSEPGTRVHDVVHSGALLAQMIRTESGAGPLTPFETELLNDLVARAGTALRAAALSQELDRQLALSRARSEDLRASRQRVVATADEARRRLERDIHDGAQQHLVALSVQLSLTATVAGRDPSRAAGLLNDLQTSATAALGTLDELTQGIFPGTLRESGLGDALRDAVTGGPIPVVVIDRTTRRFPPDIESAAYFACLEAIQNSMKHSGASVLSVELTEIAADLQFRVQDDGRGFDTHAFTPGSGLNNMTDRIESLGGTLTIDAAPGKGTSLSARIPVGRQ